MWLRSSSPIAAPPLGEPLDLGALREKNTDTTSGARGSAPAPAAPTTRQQEAELAREGGTYVADDKTNTDKQLFLKGDGTIDFKKCQDDPLGHRTQGRVLNHFNFCRWGYNTAIKLGGQGQVEGSVSFRETEVGTGSDGDRKGFINVKTDELKAQGIFSDQAGSVMSFSPTATPTSGSGVGACKADFGNGNDIHTLPVAGWRDQYVAYEVRSSESGGDQSRIDKPAYCAFQTHYQVTSPRGVVTPWNNGPTGGFRFDSATYMGNYGNKGAVFNRVTPNFSYDRKDTSVKGVAEHVFEALHAPQLTYPKKADKDIPGYIWHGEWQPIHRNYSKFDAQSKKVADGNKREKDKACAGLNRPAQHDCDEFPFASTKEGAGKGDGNFSVRMVPESENRSAGAKLVNWYGKDRILDGDAYGIYVD
ncbi:NucA/NucB deoxyribonuclease domain-containing protein [Streptomyces aurantiacus]|uniref:Deoxyribonuclease NucA/NucB domain-containing protein n=1 Tax=Streptomyces aurantiacus JA 4570 TaxID=1286094 RepID=S3ZEH3_9ACTN|nr:NucA/NucB deoxyribonuclease domain-containing protein [Streptomyces aurantiacus]EPH41034.1 hypothetical protein STRAU_5912 [Streptomyces aurantiacus JA 4570]